MTVEYESEKRNIYKLSSRIHGKESITREYLFVLPGGGERCDGRLRFYHIKGSEKFIELIIVTS